MATSEIELALRACKLNAPTSEMAIANLERTIGCQLPLAYRELMMRSNGLEGFIGEHHYLILWPVEQLAELNDAYGVPEYAPGLVLIGSDGGDTAYAFDTRMEGLPLVEVPFIGMSLEKARPKGSTITEFLKELREN